MVREQNVKLHQPALALFLAGALALISACARVQVGHTPKLEQGTSAQAQMQGPPAPEQVFGPGPQQQRKVVLFLGPGLSAALGSAGVIRALEDAKVEIAAVVGMEMGALIGAAYALSGRSNALDWQITRLKPEWFGRPRGIGSFFGGGKAAPEGLRREVDRLLGSSQNQRAKYPFWALVEKEKRVQWPSQGSISAQVTASLLREGVFTESIEGKSPEDWGDVEGELAREGLDFPRVWVLAKLPATWPHPGAQRASQSGWSRTRSGDLVIELLPPTSLDPFDFSKRSEAVYQGKRLCKEKLPTWMNAQGWGFER